MERILKTCFKRGAAGAENSVRVFDRTAPDAPVPMPASPSRAHPESPAPPCLSARQIDSQTSDRNLPPVLKPPASVSDHNTYRSNTAAACSPPGPNPVPHSCCCIPLPLQPAASLFPRKAEALKPHVSTYQVPGVPSLKSIARMARLTS